MFDVRAMLDRMMKDPRCANNARAQNVMKCLREGDRQGLINMAENICRENGSNIADYQKRIMNMFK